MTYQTTITRKGQITIPKPLRDLFGLNTSSKILLRPIKDKTGIVITSSPDILDLAGTLRPAKIVNAIEIRKKMQKQYKSR